MCKHDGMHHWPAQQCNGRDVHEQLKGISGQRLHRLGKMHAAQWQRFLQHCGTSSKQHNGCGLSYITGSMTDAQIVQFHAAH
jgi:hypothetical protein